MTNLILNPSPEECFNHVKSIAERHQDIFSKGFVYVKIPFKVFFGYHRYLIEKGYNTEPIEDNALMCRTVAFELDTSLFGDEYAIVIEASSYELEDKKTHKSIS